MATRAIIAGDEHNEPPDESFTGQWGTAQHLAADYSEIADAIWESSRERYLGGRGAIVSPAPT